MKLNTKKIIAKEIIILSSLILILFLVFISIKLYNLNIESKRQDLNFKKQLFESNLDSISKLPWNLNWNNLQNDKNGIPFPPIDILYAKQNSKDSSKIKLLLISINLKKIEIKNLTKLNSDQIFNSFFFISLILVYPLRGMYFLLKWSFKTIKK